MKTIYSSLRIKTALKVMTIAAMVFALTLQGFAQTAAGTDIKNTASATYDDGSGNSYETESNEVVVTVAKVAGLTITPDGQTNPTVVAGQTGVTMDFVVTNTGNFTDQVRFLANGGSFQFPTGITAIAAVIDPAGTPVNILTNSADVLHSLNAGDSVTVRLTFDVSGAVAAGTDLQVFLGDATTGTNFDNVAADSSASEVRTVDNTAVNGLREARGDITVKVDPDAQILVSLTGPAGPIPLGGDITYATNVCNPGARSLDPFDPDGAGPAGTAIWVVAPIPAGTEFKAGTAPAGTLFSTTDATTNPLTPADWVATEPSPASSIKRLLIPVSTSALAATDPDTCTADFNFTVTVTTNNANDPITLIVDGFGENSTGVVITDQSGDNTPGTSSTPPPGTEVEVPLAKTFSVLNGPNGAPAATGPTDNNDDFTNMSVNTGISGVAPGGVTTAAGQVVFNNTIQNTGNADDVFVMTAPTVPTGATVEISTDGGATWTTVSGGGSVNIPVAFGASANYQVRVSLPAGQTVLTGYDTVIRATSQNDNTKSNDTIDRVYTGFVRLDKAFAVTNGTGVGGATDAVPGAVIKYTITYTNVSEDPGTGGSVGLTATSLVITENGNVAPNNWGSTTDQVVGSAADSNGGTITGDSAGSSVLTDTIASLAPQASGTFTFERTIK